MQKNCYNSNFWELFLKTGNPVFYTAARLEMRTHQPLTLIEKAEEDDLTL